MKKIKILLFALALAFAPYVPSLSYNKADSGMRQEMIIHAQSEETSPESESDSGDSSMELILSVTLVLCILGIYALKRNKVI